MTTTCTKFKRREGTAGIRGHLYETKLISLIYFRAIHTEAIEDFQLASNLDNVGAFDDICFKIKVLTLTKPISVFIQAKHRENTNQELTIDLPDYFISYLNIRKHFDPNKEDWFFRSTFDDAECLFVIYTTARVEFSNETNIEDSYSSIVNDLIKTRGTPKQLDNQEDRVKSLCKVAMEEQMIHLAKQIAGRINGDVKLPMLLTDEIVFRYHVILAQKVVDVSELQPDGHRIATFRHDFFDTNEEYLTTFKDALFKEILKSRKIKTTDIKDLLSEFIADPTDVNKLSKVIGTVITYNDGFLEMDKVYKAYATPNLKRVYVPWVTVEEALKVAARDILLSPRFQMRIPSAFGNKEITLSGDDERKKQRITHLTTRITDLLQDCKLSKIVTINESLGKGFLKLNGGIAGAIGNIFVLDNDTKLMKITDNPESLGTYAKLLYESLNEKIELINENSSNSKISLCEYKFSINISKFPKLLLECTEYESYLANDFLKKLFIYSNQADEKTVEEKCLKAEMEESLTLVEILQGKVEEIFLKYHNNIQEWWLQPKEADYLTKSGELFTNVSYMIAQPLMSSISLPYVRKIKNYNYTFTQDAVDSLNLQNQQLNTIIVTENSILTVAKVIQHLKNKDYAALDMKEVVSLSTNMRTKLRIELSSTNKEKTLILVCDITMDSAKQITLKNVAEAVQNKRVIIITNMASFIMLQRYFRSADTVYDDKTNLVDMSEDCQKRVFESAMVEIGAMIIELKSFIGA